MKIEKQINEDVLLASVLDEIWNKTLYGIIDTQNHILVPFFYEEIKFYTNFFICKHANWRMTSGRNNVDIYNLNCNKIGSASINYITKFGEFYKTSYYLGEGILDSQGAVILSTVFKSVTYDVVKGIFNATFNNKPYTFTRTGIQILEDRYFTSKNEDFAVVSKILTNPQSTIYKAESILGTGILDDDYQILVPCIYEEICLLGEELALAYRYKTNTECSFGSSLKEKTERTCDLYKLPNGNPFKDVEKIELNDGCVSVFGNEDACIYFDNLRIWPSEAICLYACKIGQTWKAFNTKGDLVFESFEKIKELTPKVYIANNTHLYGGHYEYIVGDIYRVDGQLLASRINNTIESCYDINGKDAYYIINHYEIKEGLSVKEMLNIEGDEFLYRNTKRRQLMNLKGFIISDFDRIQEVTFSKCSSGYSKHGDEIFLFVEKDKEKTLRTMSGNVIETYENFTDDGLPVDLIAYYPPLHDSPIYNSDDTDWGDDEELKYIRDNGGDWIDD